MHGFFNAWNRKEAFVQAVGEGIPFGLDRFDVSLAPDEPAVLRKVDRIGYRAEDWSLAAFEPAPGYAGALVVATDFNQPALLNTRMRSAVRLLPAKWEVNKEICPFVYRRSS